jgi:hypothetical protein
LFFVVGFLISLSQVISLSPKPVDAEYQNRVGLKASLYRVAVSIQAAMSSLRIGLIKLTSVCISFLHGICILISVLATGIAAFALLQSIGDSLDSFLQAPIGTKPAHINTGFGADWWFYGFTAVAAILITWILGSFKRKLRSLVPK